NATSLAWTTSGDGSFSSTTVLNPIYTPGANDLIAGSVTLTLTAQSAAPCVEASDAMVLTISQQATANAGIDATICEGSTYTMIATATNAASITWSSNGTGTFADATIEDAVYTPSAADRLNGSVTLTMTVTSASPCINAVDQMVLSINPQATVSAGTDATICETGTYTLSGATQSNATSLLWTTSGTGTFDDATILAAEYTPSVADIAAGTVTLTLTAQSAAPCVEASDAMVLTISEEATANAGSDATICEGSTYTMVATATNTTGILWTTSGTGIFADATIEDAVYTPSQNDIDDGSVILTMTVGSESPCNNAVDQMILGISRQAVVNAGIDATICEGSTYELTGATTSNATSLLWTTNGDGSFSSTTALNPVYTPGVADIATGSAVLTLTSLSAVPCGVASDNMVLTISEQAIAFAGNDATICEGSAYTLSDATATNAASIYWTTSGTGSFNNPTLENPVYTPSQNDILDGFVNLSMTVNSDPPCGGDNDMMVLSISRTANVYAGTNATICEGSDITLSGATAVNATSIIWTTSGDGSFNNTGIIHPVYTPGITDIATGSVTLTLTGQSLAPCGPDSDAMVLTISHQSTAYAGVDATICEGSTYTISDATATNAASVLWTTTGTGVFNNPTSVNPTYIPSQNDILDGFVTLTMYANAASPCPTASDEMVLSISRRAVVYAGADATICEGSVYPISGATQTFATDILWTTTGTGSFDDPTSLNPVYTPGVEDISSGSVTLTITGESTSPCSASSDAMILNISRQAIANAGPDETICGASTISLDGASALNQISVFWTTTGTGSFSSQYMINPVYTPSENDILDGSVILTMTAYSAGPCNSASDDMILTIEAPVSVNAGVDAVICEGSVYTLSDATQLNTSGLQWTTSGSGSFDDATILHPVYTPSMADILAGNVILTLTGQPASLCEPVSDEMTLSISRQATASAGDDATICEGSVYYLFDSEASHAGSVLWTTSGTGVFNNPTLVNPTYNPSQADVLNGSVTLTLTVNAEVPCALVQDAMVITISRQASVNAGADATICENESFTISGAGQSYAASLLWTSNGDGTFDDATLLNPVYTPGLTDLVAGNVTLTLTAQSSAPCTAVDDQMRLFISRQGTAFAGEDATLCQGGSYTLSDASATFQASVQWTTSGTGTFNNVNAVKPVYTPSISDVINGSVVLTMEVTSSEGCSPATDQMTLSFAQLPAADAGTDMTVCQGDQAVILTASASNYTSISWTTSGTGTILNGNTLNPVYEPAATETGLVTLTLTAIGAESCGSVTVSDQMVITVNARITANAGADQLIPFNSTTMLEATATGGSGAYAYNWQPASLLYYENTSNPVTRVLTDHTAFIVLVTDLITGCQDADTMMVNIDGINYAPVAENDYDTTAYNTSVSINILGNDSDPENGALTISFCGYPVNGLVVLNSNNTITYTPYEGFSGNDSICYQICDKGVPVLCDNAMVYIHVLPKPDVSMLEISNGISPNRDGNNDIWKIKGIEGFPENNVKIFNRWGDQIIAMEGYDNSKVYWDATNRNGDLVPDGTYFYILEIKGIKTFTGWIYVRSEN
ncbi:MAG: hypothetical protein FD166_2886, partial [Bacteroidetes bacterium]